MQTVSIVVPVYNAEKYLKPCLRSILHQSYRNIEVILVNDGSKDGSLAICRRFAQKDKRVRVIDIPNGGVSNARNVGVAAATGEYVQFVDSDDKIHRQMVKKLIGEMETVDADMAFCGLEMVFVNGCRVVLRRPNTRKYLPPHCVMERQEFLRRLPELFRYVGGMEGPCNKMYRRSLIVDNGLSFPLDTSFGEDHLFNVSCYACCRRVVFVHDILYHYMHYGQQSLSRKCPPNLYENQMRLVDALQSMLQEQIGVNDVMRRELSWYRSANLYGIVSQYCAEDNGLERAEKIARLQTLLDTPGVLEAYYAVTPEYEFSQQIDPYLRARDATGVLQTFEAIRTQLRTDGKRPVTMFAAKQLRQYSEKHPDSRLGKAASILYLNLATVGMGETISRVWRRTVGKLRH